MTEQQQKLQEILNRRKELVEAVQKLQSEVQSKTELIYRLEGAIEAFALLEVKLPDPEAESTEATTVEAPTAE